MNRFGGMEKVRRSPGACQGGGYFGAYEAGLSHPADHDSSSASHEGINGGLEGRSDSWDQVSDSLRFRPENLATDFAGHELLPMASAMRPTSASRARNLERGRAFGPSERAFSGSSWTSTKRPSAPAAIPALARVSINSLSPPEYVPPMPGRWTEWVASKITGHWKLRMTGMDRKSTTRS